MLCKRCMVVMKSGTSYEQKKNGNRKRYKRYDECPKCHEKIFSNAPNFQETLAKETEKKVIHKI
jgi:hypothetical protein